MRLPIRFPFLLALVSFCGTGLLAGEVRDFDVAERGLSFPSTKARPIQFLSEDDSLRFRVTSARVWKTLYPNLSVPSDRKKHEALQADIELTFLANGQVVQQLTVTTGDLYDFLAADHFGYLQTETVEIPASLHPDAVKIQAIAKNSLSGDQKPFGWTESRGILNGTQRFLFGQEYNQGGMPSLPVTLIGGESLLPGSSLPVTYSYSHADTVVNAVIPRKQLEIGYYLDNPSHKLYGHVETQTVRMKKRCGEEAWSPLESLEAVQWAGSPKDRPYGLQFALPEFIGRYAVGRFSVYREITQCEVAFEIEADEVVAYNGWCPDGSCVRLYPEGQHRGLPAVWDTPDHTEGSAYVLPVREAR